MDGGSDRPFGMLGQHYFLGIWSRIAKTCERDSPSPGAVKASESHFGPHCVQGKRGREADGKTIVFSLLNRDDQTLYRDRPKCPQTAL